MSQSERDEKAYKHFEKIAMQIPGRGMEHVAEDSYKAGWDAALESDAVKKLVNALEVIANAQIGPPYVFSCEEMQAEAKEALVEFQKATALAKQKSQIK